MIFRRLLVGLALLLCVAVPAQAQKTKAQLNAEITANYPDNSVGAITPAILRTTTSDIVNAILPTAPVVSGNLACFNGTTGLLQDCGVSPTSISITAITGLGTGVATALSINIGTAGSPVVNGGAGGTPSSITLTNGTGLPTTALTGALQAAQEPAHTGDCTNTAASLALTCLKTNGVNFTTTATAAAGQLPATATNDSATAGNVGEYIESPIVIGSAVSLVTATDKTITSLALTAGDWDVDAVANFLGNGSTSFTVLGASFSTTTNVSDFTTPGRSNQVRQPATIPGANSNSVVIPPYRFSVSGNTTIFLVGTAVFSAGTENGWGLLRARRVR